MAVPHRRGIGSAWEPIPEVPPREPGQPRCSRSVSRSLQRASLRCTRHELGAVAGCNTPAGHPCSDGHPCQFCPAKTLPWTPTIERNLFCKRDATPLEVRFLQAHVPAPAVLFASLLGTRGFVGRRCLPICLDRHPHELRDRASPRYAFTAWVSDVERCRAARWRGQLRPQTRLRKEEPVSSAPYPPQERGPTPYPPQAPRLPT